jgi:hypothetical protein
MFKNKDLVNFYLNQCLTTLDVRKCAGHFLRLLETSRLVRSILKKRCDIWKTLWRNDEFPCCMFNVNRELENVRAHTLNMKLEKIWDFLYTRPKHTMYALIYSCYKNVAYKNDSIVKYNNDDEVITINKDIKIYSSGEIHYVNDKSKSITLEEFYGPYLNLF